MVMLSGCNPVTAHKITSTIFDGVPSLPPAEDYCRDYHEKKLAEELEAAKKQQLLEVRQTGSTHPPYAEKNCDSCHDKTKDNGLTLPKRELCFSCHPDINKGEFTHGPVAVGECLSCHDPHSSQHSSLLKIKSSDICSSCHKEMRLAVNLHFNGKSRGMICTECHGPHAGTTRYFLK